MLPLLIQLHLALHILLEHLLLILPSNYHQPDIIEQINRYKKLVIQSHESMGTLEIYKLVIFT